MERLSDLLLALVLTLLVSVSACGKAQPTWQEQYDLGVRYLSEGNYEEAVIAFTAAIEIEPNQARAYVGRGDAYIKSGETEENLSLAQMDYEQAIELDETSADAYLGLADVYIRQGDYDKALKVLKEALAKIDSDQSIADKIAEMEGGEITDSSGNVRRMNAYDEAGKLCYYHIYTYDISGEMETVASFDIQGNETSRVELFHDEGDVSVSYGWDPETGVLTRGVYIYDERGFLIKVVWYNSFDKVINYYIIHNDEQGQQIRADSYGPDGKLWGYDTYEYIAGNVSRENHYDSGGVLYEYYIFEYDENGHQIRYSRYNADGALQMYHINHYDSQGNNVGYDEYDSEGNLIISTVTEK